MITELLGALAYAGGGLWRAGSVVGPEPRSAPTRVARTSRPSTSASPCNGEPVGIYESPPRRASCNGEPIGWGRRSGWQRSRRWPASPQLLRDPHRRGVLVVRRGRRRRGRGRGGHARSLRRHQRGRRDRRRAHQRGPGPHRRPGGLAAGHRRGEGRHRQEGFHLRLRRDRPGAPRPARGHRGGADLVARRRTSTASSTCSPWAVGRSRCAPRTARWTTCSCRSTVSTRPTTRLSPSPPSRPSSTGRSTTMWCRRASPT
jgi:hypothetical protein